MDILNEVLNTERKWLRQVKELLIEATQEDCVMYSYYSNPVEDCFNSFNFTITEKGDSNNCVMGNYYIDAQGIIVVRKYVEVR